MPDAVAPPPLHPRFPLMDGMRAIAVLAVVAVHVTVFADPPAGLRYLIHLNIGVTIFFLISGFLLYRPFIAHRTGGPAAPGIGKYAKRRLLRILPAYWLVLAVLAIVPGLTATAGESTVAHVILLQTLLPIGSESSCVTALLDCGLAQTWSLVAEVTFYALLPLYVLLAGRLAVGRTPRQWVPLELALLALLAVASVALRFTVMDTTALFTGSVAGYVLWFALGMALAVLSVGGLEAGGAVRSATERLGRHPTVAWAAAVVAYFFLARALPPTPFVLATGEQLLAHVGFGVIAALLMLPAVFDDRAGGLPRRLLGLRPVAWLGLISYGIFLWHYVFTVELGSPGEGLGWLPLLAVTLGGTIPIAAASYYAVERPILKLKYR